MEAAGLVIGVAGLAGLFESVLDAVDRVNDYRSYTADSKTLAAQFDGYRAQLARWGRQVGLDNGQLSAGRRHILDSQTLSAASQLLQIANEILEPGGPGKSNTVEQPGSRPNVPANSRRAKLGWALGGKSEQTAKVKSFGKIVQQLSQLVPGQRPGSSGFTAIDSSLEDFLAEIRKMNAQAAADRTAQMKRELAKWLLGDEPANETYRDSLHKRLPGTCEWIFNQPEFLEWNMKDSSEPKHSLLWIYGHAGFGKTVLCAQIVQRLISNDDRQVAYFFFSSDFASIDDPYVALRSLVLQLAFNNAVAFELACNTWNDETDQVMASRHIIIQLLRQMLLKVPSCTLVIDGLDECTKMREGSGHIETFLADLRHAMAETTRVLIVSRDEPEIRQALGYNGDQGSIHLKISPDHVRRDTDILSHHIVSKKLPNKTDEIKKDLSERLSARCDGQFIWLMMQTVSLRKGSNFKALKQTIEETPAGLNQLYQRNWNSILAQEERDKRQAFAFLRWAAFSSRPLTVGEMAEAVLLDESVEDFPIDELPDAIDDDYIDSEILGLCGALLEVRHQSKDQPPEQRTVHVAHFSVREYLVHQLPIGNLKPNESLRLSNERAHRSLLSRLCLAYITCNASWATAETAGFERCFRNYAASSWHSYAASCAQDEVDPALIDLLLEFMKETHPCWSSWRQWFDEQDDDQNAKEDAETVNGPSGALYYSLRLGLDEISHQLALSESFSPCHKRIGRSPFHLACSQGNSKVVSALLRGDTMSQVNARWLHGLTPLHSAAKNGHIAVVQILLQAGADLSILSNDRWTPLNLAAVNGHLDTVRLLLDRGADLSIATDKGWTPLIMAISNRHPDTVRLLLDKGADLSVADSSGKPPLSLAILYGYTDIVHLLLDRGAEISITSDTIWTPLNTAVLSQRLDILGLLLDRGADSSIASGYKGLAPLAIAVSRGSLDTVRLLLDRGADLSVSFQGGSTPLHVAIQRGHFEVVRLLLDGGADLSIADENGWTALHLAASRGCPKIVSILADRGADLFVPDTRGRTPLTRAAKNNHPDIVALLLERFPDTSAAEGRKERSIDRSSQVSNIAASMSAFPANDMNTTDNTGRTALFYAARCGFTNVVRVLLSYRHIEPMQNDRFGSTALSAAVTNGHCDIVKLLLESLESYMTLGEDFTWPTNLWTLRSDSLEVSQLLEEYSQKHGTPLQLTNLFNNSNSDLFDATSAWCDGCTRPFPPGAAFHTCPVCLGGDVCFCEECIEAGAQCR